MPDIGFINGTFMPLAQAMVSVEDRGYQFGDGIYEVLRTYRGVPFQLDAHLERLSRSARGIELPEAYDKSQWGRYIEEGIARGGYADSKVYVQVTRGVAPRDHAFPAAAQPTAVMTIREMRPLAPALAAAGVHVITLPDLRWGRCDIKTINLLPNLLARQQANRRGTYEAILHRDDSVTEGSVSNVMIVLNGTLATPPESSCILSGVTRAVVLDLARKDGVEVRERALSLRELRAADEVFLTGTTVEVLPVVRVDDLEIGGGKPGPVTKRLRALFHASLD
jgi:D-alanine transaminase